MNEARKKVEDWKSQVGSDETRKIHWEIKLPEGHQSKDYHLQIAAESLAFDEKIAEKLGVKLTDSETWPDEQAKLAANDWAGKLPDK